MKNISVTPTVELYLEQLNSFASINELRDFLESTRIAVKKAVNYGWDNNHSYLVYNGKRVMSISIYTDFIGLYSAPEYDEFCLPNIPWKDNDVITAGQVNMLRDYANNIIKGLQYCCRTKNWYPKSEMKRLGYSGRVHQSVFKVGDDVVDTSG